ncbi:MAG: MarR family winged helix-turn-helix transcriptional regulator [Actinomycetota bacterium]
MQQLGEDAVIDPISWLVAHGRSVVDDTTYQALARFRYQLRLFHRFSEDAARAAGLTPSQHQLMLAIKGWWGPRPPTIGDLAELLQLKHHSTVELAKRTEATGMVESEPDPSDRRRRQLSLTAAGERKLYDSRCSTATKSVDSGPSSTTCSAPWAREPVNP